MPNHKSKPFRKSDTKLFQESKRKKKNERKAKRSAESACASTDELELKEETP
eukprot:CAMPEP_0114982350 /NCGR_PEP_ID=MMETSP0216-20121206/6060_1 /TAXON_ID=223996 /ORGANISM="Protocruzia adherens, Strain Boccale" /LENGTH=51 /DNA_ID=CAMNT_0002344141 /DNA_START=505 /DNA_END=660 /DNA_ORIENTATION=-